MPVSLTQRDTVFPWSVLCGLTTGVASASHPECPRPPPSTTGEGPPSSSSPRVGGHVSQAPPLSGGLRVLAYTPCSRLVGQRQGCAGLELLAGPQRQQGACLVVGDGSQARHRVLRAPTQPLLCCANPGARQPRLVSQILPVPAGTLEGRCLNEEKIGYKST